MEDTWWDMMIIDRDVHDICDPYTLGLKILVHP